MRERQTMKTLLRLITAGASVLAILPMKAGAANVKPALYTAPQAEHGASVYQQSCAACHGNLLEGVAAPALKGSAFNEMATAQSLTVDGLLTVVANTMPQSDPGSLKPEQINAVVAYILQQNSYPAGPTALTAYTAAQAHISVGTSVKTEGQARKADIRDDKGGARKMEGAIVAKKAEVHRKTKHLR